MILRNHMEYLILLNYSNKNIKFDLNHKVANILLKCAGFIPRQVTRKLYFDLWVTKH